jgi:hypothetical protein
VREPSIVTVVTLAKALGVKPGALLEFGRPPTRTRNGGNSMNTNERAAQIWAVLAWAATHRQTITYSDLGRLIGVPPFALGPRLDPIQDYCLAKGLPGLTSIVVTEQTGRPSHGFTAAEDAQAEQAKVFRYNWLERGTPQPSEFPAGLSAGQ